MPKKARCARNNYDYKIIKLLFCDKMIRRLIILCQSAQILQ